MRLVVTTALSSLLTTKCHNLFLEIPVVNNYNLSQLQNFPSYLSPYLYGVQQTHFFLNNLPGSNEDENVDEPPPKISELPETETTYAIVIEYKKNQTNNEKTRLQNALENIVAFMLHHLEKEETQYDTIDLGEYPLARYHADEIPYLDELLPDPLDVEYYTLFKESNLLFRDIYVLNTEIFHIHHLHAVQNCVLRYIAWECRIAVQQTTQMAELFCRFSKSFRQAENEEKDNPDFSGQLRTKIQII